MQHEKWKMWSFWGLFDPLPPSDQCWILWLWSNLCICQHLSFQHWLGGEGVGDHFFTFMWSDPSMMSSSFVAFLSVKTIKKNFEILNYFPQKRTLWRGQSLSSPSYSKTFSSDPPSPLRSYMKKLHGADPPLPLKKVTWKSYTNLSDPPPPLGPRFRGHPGFVK